MKNLYIKPFEGTTVYGSEFKQLASILGQRSKLSSHPPLDPKGAFRWGELSHPPTKPDLWIVSSFSWIFLRRTWFASSILCRSFSRSEFRKSRVCFVTSSFGISITSCLQENHLHYQTQDRKTDALSSHLLPCLWLSLRLTSLAVSLSTINWFLWCFAQSKCLESNHIFILNIVNGTHYNTNLLRSKRNIFIIIF